MAESMKPQRGSWPGKLAFYIDVDDLAAYRKNILQAGGRSSWTRWTCLDSASSLSLFEDPDGRVLGMWKQQK